MKKHSLLSRTALLSGVFALAIGFAGHAQASSDAPKPPSLDWSFAGPFGTFDQAQLQRGFKVYKEVCAACHSMNLMKYRNLSDKGGPMFSKEQVKAIAAEYKVKDGPNDAGEMFERPGLPTDKFVAPFPNVKAAAAANNGKAPPDLSVMAKARTVERGFPLFIADMFTGKSNELGVDYIHAVLTGYKEAPKGFELGDGLNYNEYFPGHAIAMPNVLSDGQVDYTDGSAQTADQYARDVTAFLMWTAEPKLQERKQIGFQAMIFLLVLSVLLYLSNKKVWKSLKGK